MPGADTPPPSQRLRAAQRVKRNRDFRAVRELGRRTDCGVFQLLWAARPAPADTTPARAGVVASKAAVGNAVQRNRAKRRLREVFRKHQHLVPAGLDLVLTARAAVLRQPLAEVEQRFVAACRKLAPRPPSPPSAPHA